MSLRYKGAVISATPPTTTGGESGVASGSWTLEQQFQAQGAGNWPEPFVAKYIEDVFSTYLYTNNTYPSNLTITNGIDLSGKGGLVWMKNRNLVRSHNLYDTARGAYKQLRSDSTGAQITNASGYGLTAFNADGFSLGTDIDGENYGNVVSWTFREQPKFFDVVTYTGAGDGTTVSHNLGSTPGCVIVKATSGVDGWFVYHRDLSGPTNRYLRLDKTDSVAFISSWISVSDTTITFPTAYGPTASGGTSYVAYLFAHNAGGFGLTGTDNVISCGSYTGTGSVPNNITLGFEPQWLLVKSATYAGQEWGMFDSMRGLVTGSGGDAYLYANSSGAEGSGTYLAATATGFSCEDASARYNNSGDTYIYIAIRRGPMKAPTSGTSVFSPIARSGTGSTTTVTGTSFPPDLVVSKIRAGSTNRSAAFFDKLRGASKFILSAHDFAEDTDTFELTSFNMDGYTTGPDNQGNNYINASSTTYSNWIFSRAPNFFDEVCYTGNSVQGRTITHNLGVTPELIIVKPRSNGGAWYVYNAVNTATQYMLLNSSQSSNAASFPWNDTEPTSSVFTVQGTGGSGLEVNWTGYTYVAYLFATCAGVSKVGSYTGTGTTLQVNCGFTGGARFVLIKRTDSTGDWYVWDSARGIVAGNDPYLLLNSTAAEVTSTDYVDTYSAGFEITSTAPAAINASGGTFIFLAIA